MLTKTPLRPKQGESKPDKKPDPNVQIDNPSVWEAPSFFMCPPFHYETATANNAWMSALSDEERKIDYDLARKQWLDLYQFLASQGFVQTVPNHKQFQDIVFVANLGIVLLHLKEPIVVVSKYRSEPRKGEEDVGRILFEQMGYKVRKPPLCWEGEAETKALRDNIYLGGYGFRTDKKVYDWFRSEFDMKIVTAEMTDEKLYHWDTMCFPLTKDTVFLANSLLDNKEVSEIEKVADVIPVSVKLAHSGITNCVRVAGYILCMSNIAELTPSDDDWDVEHEKVAFLEKELPKYGLEPVIFNLSEYEKGGAALSCLVMHAGRQSYRQPLL